MIDELRQLCRRARQQRPDIESVVLFGSYARGSCGPRSDADLFVVLADSPHARRMDRIPDLLRVFAPTPVPLDIVPWTRAELGQARERGDRWLALYENALALFGHDLGERILDTARENLPLPREPAD